MSIERLRNEVSALPSDQRRRLMAFMVALEDQGSDHYAAELAQRIDDKSPERWRSAEQCERELGFDSE